MARKSNTQVESDGPSTGDVSVNEDVEMQDEDQETETKMGGFKKLGVSASRPLPSAPLARQSRG
jgi:SWI/SNF-related matrix-associated actin-dependent regulator of chromatin subfamily A member 5